MRIMSLFSCFIIMLGLSTQSFAQEGGVKTSSSEFQEVFTVAGYSALIGAGVGTAALVFSKNPSENARYVAIGASVGFVAGCLFGGYLVIAPSFNEESKARSSATLDSVDIKGSLWGADSLAFEAKLDGSFGGVKALAVHLPVFEF